MHKEKNTKNKNFNKHINLFKNTEDRLTEHENQNKKFIGIEFCSVCKTCDPFLINETRNIFNK
jgi:hypothetical protein